MLETMAGILDLLPLDLPDGLKALILVLLGAHLLALISFQATVACMRLVLLFWASPLVLVA